jgi:hypothetical protein
MIFVMVKVLCFICGTDWILKYYLDELRLQRVKILEGLVVVSSGHDMLNQIKWVVMNGV